MNHFQDYSVVTEYVNSNQIPFFQTPFFQKYLREQETAYEQEQNDKIKVTIGIRAFSVALNSVMIHNVWPEATVDRYRNNIDLLGSFINLTDFKKDGNIVKWCREKMRPATFFNMIRRYMDKTDLNSTNEQWRDTVSALSKLILRKMDIQPPTRWRLEEFHDYVNGILIEVSTENVPFEDNTIKEPYVEGNYKVYQPQDRVALAKWGSAVGNCVLTYSDRILEHESEIVFIEEEGIPSYTVQINYGPLDAGRLEIKQLQARYRKSYSTTTDERQLCQSLIENAIGLRK